MVSQKKYLVNCSRFVKCINLSLDFQIKSELKWFNFKGNSTSILAKKRKNEPKVAPFVIIKVATVDVE